MPYTRGPRYAAHQTNIEAKARRALDAIDRLVLVALAEKVIGDRVEGLRSFSKILIVQNDPGAWAAIGKITGDTDFRESRELIMSGLRDRIDFTAAPPPVDPFEGLHQ